MIGSQLASLPLGDIAVHSPTGPAWEFLVLFVVVIVGPPLLERARLPGIIGLLVGGFLIGPNGLNLIGEGNMTVPELGQLGLLYLMFVAGVELDLGLLRVHRRAVVIFGLSAFAIPMLFGSAVGFSMHWEAPAALLLGSLMASHTLLVYPTVRNAGLSGHRAVATAVGATVLTDTLSLVVLAVVSGSQEDGGSAASVGLQVAFGLLVLVSSRSRSFLGWCGSRSDISGRTGSSGTCSPSRPSSGRRRSRTVSVSRESSAHSSQAWDSTDWFLTRDR